MNAEQTIELPGILTAQQEARSLQRLVRRPWNVLNLYSGIGGNRKLWQNVKVTAVEINPEIAAIYKDLHPHDTVITGDAHEYLEANYRGWDFIWSSPPCQSHSKVRMMASKAGSYDAVMPSMNLWAEIIFLRHFAECPWTVENVKPYYDVLIPPTTELHRHFFWANFWIPANCRTFDDGLSHNERGTSEKGTFDLRKYDKIGRAHV